MIAHERDGIVKVSISTARQEYKIQYSRMPLARDTAEIDASSTNEIADCELAWFVKTRMTLEINF